MTVVAVGRSPVSGPTRYVAVAVRTAVLASSAVAGETGLSKRIHGISQPHPARGFILWTIRLRHRTPPKDIADYGHFHP